MEKLVKGILDFRQKLLETYRREFAHLALGQFPDTLFIACSDSRVVPNLFASTNPGDLFVIRNVGNLIPPLSSSKGTAEAAAIEFALTKLPITEVVVCGHSECGAMQAIVEGTADSPLREWLKHCDCTVGGHGTPSKDLSVHNQLAQKNVLQQIKHLKTYPMIQQKIEKKVLNIHGWYFDIKTGDVYAYEEMFDQFVLMDETEALRILSRLKPHA